MTDIILPASQSSASLKRLFATLHLWVGVIIGIPAGDGRPPYVVRWQDDGHISMIFPDQYARVIPARAGPGPA